MPEAPRIYLGTVALEPNRWGQVSADRRPALRPEEWLEGANSAGFDGVELWENHVAAASPEDVAAVLESKVPLRIFNSYASLEDPADDARAEAAGWVRRTGCTAVKYNVGRADADRAAYVSRLQAWADELDDVDFLCECHGGTIAEDPAVAAQILEAAGPPERFGAIVHLGDDVEYLDAMFDALGERIGHVHVNFLRQGAPPLDEIADDVRARVQVLNRRGFAGSYTVEFVNGVGTEGDRPADLLAVAVRDLAFLRNVLV
jgi:sugar phosphate isomerase/epimerase